MSTGYLCAGCKDRIFDKYVIFAVDQTWHEDCLRCYSCRVRLCDADAKLFHRDGMILCRQDYTRLYAQEGSCASCKQKIYLRDMIMRAKDKIYHVNCFKCGVCNTRFCVGDKFSVQNDQLLCEYDYEEKRMFLMAAYNNASLEAISKNIQELDEFEIDESRQL